MAQNNKVPRLFYLLAVLSFLPVAGIFIGLVLLIVLHKESFVNKKIINTFLILGILSSFAFYFFISKTYSWGNVYHHTTVVESTKKLTRLIDKIEIYNKKFGHFPESLEIMKADVEDPILQLTEDENKGIYYYELNEQGYYLFSLGFDNTPFTSDDVFPNIKCKNLGSYSLINCIAKKKRR